MNTAAVNTCGSGFLGVAVPVGVEELGNGHGVNILVGGPFRFGRTISYGRTIHIPLERRRGSCGRRGRLRESVVRNTSLTSGQAEAEFFLSFV